MSEPQLSTRQSSSTYHRVCMLLFVGVLVTVVAIVCYLAFARQHRISPGNTEAHPGMLLLQGRP